jgi:hypothetical protein
MPRVARASESDMDSTAVIVVAGAAAGAAAWVARRVERSLEPGHWRAYLEATPGDRNRVVWSSKAPALAEAADRFVDMYTATWATVTELWPAAAERLAEVGRARAFAEAEAAFAPLTGVGSRIERFVAAYSMMAMVTFDAGLHGRLVAADVAGENLSTAAADYIASIAPDPLPAPDLGPVGDYVAARWRLSPWAAGKAREAGRAAYMSAEAGPQAQQ